MDKPVIAVINGPNLNLLGKREPEVYGWESFEQFFALLVMEHPEAHLHHFQSNIEGELIDELHKYSENCHGIILNPGGYSHTSVALADAIAAINTLVVEVHISNVHAREDYRQTLITASKCAGVITGCGLNGYRLALQYLLEYKK